VPLDILHGVEAALGKNAEDPVLLDLRGKSDVADFFLVCHGNSERHIRAIVDAIDERLGQVSGRYPTHVEGRGAAEWVLMDYRDFVVHVFREDRRQFYRLESLWSDAPSIPLGERPRGLGASRSR
jgi:ribosome-associated protein